MIFVFITRCNYVAVFALLWILWRVSFVNESADAEVLELHAEEQALDRRLIETN